MSLDVTRTETQTAATIAPHRRRLPHWGWLLAGGTLLLMGTVMGTVAWSLMRADALLESIRAEGVEFHLYKHERPDWMTEWMKKVGWKFELVPGVDRLNGIQIRKGDSERVFPLLEYAPEIESLYLTEISESGIRRLGTLKTLQSLSFSGKSSVTNESLRPLAQLSELQGVSIESGLIDDRGLAWFAALPRFEGLSFFGEGQPFSGEGLAEFGREARLTSLMLRHVRLNDEAGHEISKLRGLKLLVLDDVTIPADAASGFHALPKLATLYLNRSSIGDDAFAKSEADSWPPYLNLGATDVGDRGVRMLSKSRRVKILVLSQTRLTDAAAESLAEMVQLQGLYLSETEVSDLTLRVLENLPALKRLDVETTQCTREGVEAFRAARPDVEVTSDFR